MVLLRRLPMNMTMFPKPATARYPCGCSVPLQPALQVAFFSETKSIANRKNKKPVFSTSKKGIAPAVPFSVLFLFFFCSSPILLCLLFLLRFSVPSSLLCSFFASLFLLRFLFFLYSFSFGQFVCAYALTSSHTACVP